MIRRLKYIPPFGDGDIDGRTTQRRHRKNFVVIPPGKHAEGFIMKTKSVLKINITTPISIFIDEPQPVILPTEGY